MRRERFDIAAIAAAAGLVVAPAAAAAQEWTGQVTLYGWGAGIGGDFMRGTEEISFDKSLSEVLEDLDGAFFATGLARRGELVVFGDLTWSRSSREGATPVGPASGEIEIRSLTLAAGRRFVAGGGTTVDVLGGVRSWSVEAEAEAPFAGLSISPDADFVDPVVAVRVNTPLAEGWSVLTYLDLGGLGVGSEFTWQAAVTANFRATDSLFLSLGYRHLYLDYEDGSTSFEGNMSGPVAGVTFQF